MIQPRDADTIEVVEALLCACVEGPRGAFAAASREILRALREHRDDDAAKAVREACLGPRACMGCAAHYAAGGLGCCPACRARLAAEVDQ